MLCDYRQEVTGLGQHYNMLEEYTGDVTQYSSSRRVSVRKLTFRFDLEYLRQ